jgi:hypothetical protein
MRQPGRTPPGKKPQIKEGGHEGRLQNSVTRVGGRYETRNLGVSGKQARSQETFGASRGGLEGRVREMTPQDVVQNMLQRSSLCKRFQRFLLIEFEVIDSFYKLIECVQSISTNDR